MNSEDIKKFFKQISEEIEDAFKDVEFLFAVNGESIFQFNVFNKTDAVFFLRPPFADVSADLFAVYKAFNVARKLIAVVG